MNNTKVAFGLQGHGVKTWTSPFERLLKTKPLTMEEKSKKYIKTSHRDVSNEQKLQPGLLTEENGYMEVSKANRAHMIFPMSGNSDDQQQHLVVGIKPKQKMRN